ncbi:MAG: SurA N-terminal domain-containing protein [Myxococcota bacterium]
MLDYMRKNSNSLFMYVLFAGLAVVFALSFGPGSSGFSSAGDEFAATVNGEVIPANQFRVAFSQQRDAITKRFAGASPGFDTSFLLNGLEQRIIDDLIAKVLMKQEAERLGLVVSDDELAKFMEANIFTGDGVTPQVYRDWVRQVHMTTPESFEERLKAELLGEKVRGVIESNVAVSDEELKKSYELENNRAKVTFVRFDTNSTAADLAAPTDAELDAVIAGERPALEERYNKDIFKYRNPEERKYRQIVKAIPEGADDAAIATLRAKMVALKEQLSGGADFASLAATESDDVASKDKGGDMGAVKRGLLPRELETALFTLQMDALSEPVQTPTGLHLLQLTEIIPSSNKPIDEVIREVATAYLQEKKKQDAAKNTAAEFLAKLKEDGKIEELTVSEQEKREKAAEVGSTPVRVTSPWILKTQASIPRVGSVDGLVDEVFALTSEAPLLDRVVESNNAFFVLKLEERETPDLAAFDDKKEVLRETEISKKRTRVVNDWLEHLRSEAKILYNPILFAAKEDDASA